MEKSAVRAFVAIELPPPVKMELGRMQKELGKDAGPEPGWVRPENIHLTLKFLGDVNAEDVEKIADGLSMAARGIVPFTVSLGGMRIKDKRLVWVEVDDHEAMSRLKNDIEDALEPLGFGRERRPFKAHLTLCRIKSGAQCLRIGKMMEKTAGIRDKVGFEVTDFVFMKSELNPSGARYDVIRRIRLDNRSTPSEGGPKTHGPAG